MMEHFYSGHEYYQAMRQGPLGPHLDGFADLLFARGYAKYSGRHRLRLAGDLNQWLDRQQIKAAKLNEQHIQDFLAARKRKLRQRRSDKPTLALLLNYLRQTGVVPQPLPLRLSPVDRLGGDYARFLSRERGLTQVTLDYYLATARQFLVGRFGDDQLVLESLRVEDVTRFILERASTLSSARTSVVTSVLRSFLRFLYQQGKLASNLALSVPAVANQHSKGLPVGLDSQQVKKLLSCCDQTSRHGLRDYAILLLLARLGLRACEVVRLTLEDINWEAGDLLVRGKGDHQERLPLLPDVGRALANYLQKARPGSECRRVFIRLIAPRQGFITSSAVKHVVERALVRAKLHPKHRGAHLLRHSLATNMLRQGASLLQIGQVLRHRQLQTTEVYAKVDLASLRRLAQPWPGGAR